MRERIILPPDRLDISACRVIMKYESRANEI